MGVTTNYITEDDHGMESRWFHSGGGNTDDRFFIRTYESKPLSTGFVNSDYALRYIISEYKNYKKITSINYDNYIAIYVVHSPKKQTIITVKTVDNRSYSWDMETVLEDIRRRRVD